MHERRNAVVIVLFCVAMAWGLLVWLWGPDHWQGMVPSLRFHQWLTLGIVLLLGAFLVYAYKFQEKLPDNLGQMTMGRYYELDGLCFVPMMRVNASGDRAELSLYYQTRFEGLCEAVIHVSPHDGAFFSHNGALAVHFTFQCERGAFGVIHQPVGIKEQYQGKRVALQMAAAVRWVRERGEQLRSKQGMPCGTFNVDWGRAYAQSAHELSTDIKLKNPVRLELLMPENVKADITRSEYVHETLAAVP